MKNPRSLLHTSIDRIIAIRYREYQRNHTRQQPAVKACEHGHDSCNNHSQNVKSVQSHPLKIRQDVQKKTKYVIFGILESQ